MRGRFVVTSLVILLTIAVAAACSSESGGGDFVDGGGEAAGSDSATVGDVVTADVASSAECESLCTQAETACQGGKTLDRKRCLEFCPCGSGLYRSDLVIGILACSGTCRTKTGDGCMYEVATPYVTDPQVTSFRTTCLARRTECNDGGTGFLDDYCYQPGARPAFIDDLATCFALPCDQIRACLTAKYRAVGCK